MAYVNLHNHSEYSFLDGFSKIPDLVKRTIELGYPALAVTDHGNLCCSGELYRECKKQGVKPIIGCEFYCVTDARVKEGKRGYYHLVMLARDFDGYRALVRLSRYAADPNHFYYTPRIDRIILEEMREWWDHVVVMSACPSGELSRSIAGTPGEFDKEPWTPEQIISWHKDLFPHYYVELMQHNIDPKDNMPLGDTMLNYKLVALAREQNVPLVVTNDSHYVLKEEKEFHTMLRAIRFNKLVAETDPFDGDGYWYKTSEEHLQTFAAVDLLQAGEEGLKNSLAIADGIDIVMKPLDDKSWFFPRTTEEPLPQWELKQVAQLCIDNLGKIQCSPDQTNEYIERLRMELQHLGRAGFAGYMLVSSDYIRWAKAQGISVGPGRGSVCGSLVAYLLDITDVDPILHELLFERFIDPERIKDSVPDIDIDFEDRRRQEVVEYILNKYGSQQAAVVCNFAQLKLKAAFKNIAKAWGLTFAQANGLVKHFGPDDEDLTEFPEAIEKEADKFPGMLPYVQKLKDIKHHTGVHAAGVVITCDNQLQELVPMLYQSSQNRMVTAYDMEELKEWGIIKFDILGLRTLSTISEAVKLVEKDNPGFVEGEWRSVCNTLSDPGTYEMLANGDTVGVFQMEGNAATSVCTRIKPGSFEEIVAINALSRPGVSKMIDKYIRNKSHPQNINWYGSEAYHQATKTTYGVCLFQEQAMLLAQNVAHISPAELSIFMKGIKTTDPAQAAQSFSKVKDSWFKGCDEHGVNLKTARDLWDLVCGMGEYSFNRSHATAYSIIGFQTAYLKKHYPGAYFAACMITSPDDAPTYIKEVRRSKVKILPPDINKSEETFAYVDGNIYYGLSNIKQVGDVATKAILASRPFASKEEWEAWQSENKRAVNSRIVEGLRESGALENLGIPPEGHRGEMEQKWLGTYVVADPMEEWRECIHATFSDPYNEEAWQQAINHRVERVVELAGTVEKVHDFVDSKGRAMAFYSVSFEGITTECVAFAQQYASIKRKLKVGEIVWVRGKYQPGKGSVVTEYFKLAREHYNRRPNVIGEETPLAAG